MGQTLTLTAADGHSLGAYRADAGGGAHDAARGGIVVLQEVFGVNVHIREVCDGFAADGFTCIAPRSTTARRARIASSDTRRTTSRSAAGSVRSSPGTTR